MGGLFYFVLKKEKILLTNIIYWLINSYSLLLHKRILRLLILSFNNYEGYKLQSCYLPLRLIVAD